MHLAIFLSATKIPQAVAEIRLAIFRHPRSKLAVSVTVGYVCFLAYNPIEYMSERILTLVSLLP